MEKTVEHTIYGMPVVTALTIIAVPVAIGVVLFLWGLRYKHGDRE